MIEVKTVAHSHMGGTRIGADTMTRIPGLFTVGECSCGLHDASRIAGNGGAEALLMGDACGIAVSEHAADTLRENMQSFSFAAREALVLQ